MKTTVSQARLVAGGGISGLMAAWILSRETSDPVFLIESSPEFGGLLRGFRDPEWGRLDQGMHTFTSSGVAELDSLMFELFARSEWSVMEGRRRDVSGLYFRNRLQKDCHYFDLRHLPEPLFRQALGDFFAGLKAPGGRPPATMKDYAVGRFGSVIAELCHVPAIRKMYGLSPEAVDPVAAQIFPLDRVHLFSEDAFRELMPSELLRSLVAYPDQRNLPLEFGSGRYSLYPRDYGAHRLVDAVVERLRERSARLLPLSHIRSLETDGRRVRRAVVETPEATLEFIEPRSVLWTCGIPGLARLLELPGREENFQSFKKPAAANLLISREPDVGDLHYFWCFDPEFRSYRVTLPHNFTSIETFKGLFPVGMEFALDPDFENDPKALTGLAARELKGYGLIRSEDEVKFAVGGVLPAGFPCFSTANKVLLETLLDGLRRRSLENLRLTGIQAEWGVIFQPDVLAHTFRTVRETL